MTRTTRLAALERQIQRLETRLTLLRAENGRLANARLIAFIMAVLIGTALFLTQGAGWWAAVSPFLFISNLTLPTC